MISFGYISCMFCVGLVHGFAIGLPSFSAVLRDVSARQSAGSDLIDMNTRSHDIELV